MPGRREARYYAEGSKQSRRDIENVLVKPSDGSVDALVTVREQDPAPAGLSAAHRPSLSTTDVLTTVAPMTQALVHSLDRVQWRGERDAVDEACVA